MNLIYHHPTYTYIEVQWWKIYI